MYRLVRKFRARVKVRELAVFCVTLTVAVLASRGAASWFTAAVGSSEFESAAIGQVSAAYALGGASDTGDLTEAMGPPRHDSAAAATTGFYASLTYTRPQGARGESVGWSRDIETAYPANPEEQHITAEDEVRGADTDTTDERTAGNRQVSLGSVRNGQAVNQPEGQIRQAEETGPFYTVKVVADGVRNVYKTAGKTVTELFLQEGISLSADDRLSGAYLDGVINSDLYIEVKRVKRKTVVEDEKIPAKVVYRDNSKLEKGRTNVVRAGSDGLKRVEYELVYEDGVQVAKNALSEEVLTEAVSQIVEQGTVGTFVGKDGKTYSYSKVIDVKCTAYTSSYEDTGKRPGDPAFGITKSGAVAKKGIVAVDPNVIPLGTRMYIHILDDTVEDYGFAVAGDTGGKIKGKKVDLYFDASREVLRQFGVRKAKVYILD